MTLYRNRYHTLWFDPGYIATGWAWFVIDARAFTNHRARVHSHIIDWDTGEFTGPFADQCNAMMNLAHSIRFGEMPFVPRCHIGSESFRLSQLAGGEELYRPIELNAVMKWYCQTRLGCELVIQDRTLRLGKTKERLKAMGFSWRGKDSFAAMQHAVTWLQRIKQQSNKFPWTLDDDGAL